MLRLLKNSNKVPDKNKTITNKNVVEPHLQELYNCVAFLENHEEVL